MSLSVSHYYTTSRVTDPLSSSPGRLDLIAQINSPIAKEMRALGITPLAISYDQPESLRSALEGVEVVVSTIGGSALAGEAQFELAKACHATETVKLFVSRYVPYSPLSSCPIGKETNADRLVLSCLGVRLGRCGLD